MQSKAMMGLGALAAAVLALLHPADAAAQFVVAVGGDSCDSTPADCDKTARVVESIRPSQVWMLGDGAYNDGTLAEYQTRYNPNWGRFLSITKPILGNHDYYETKTADGYYTYFGNAGVQTGTKGRGYYSFNAGDHWKVIALNSGEYGDSSDAPGQLEWLKTELAANTRPCVAMMLHDPLISWGNYRPGSSGYSHPNVKPLYDAAYAAGVDLVLTGHDHNYQRYVKMNPSLQPDSKGFVQLIVGTGGRDLYPMSSQAANQSILAVRGNSTSGSKAASGSVFGVVKLTLNPTGYAGEFVPSHSPTGSDFGQSTRAEFFSGTCNAKGTGGGTGTLVHNINLPSVSTGSWSSTYPVSIPAGTTRLVVNTSGGTGDADLYVNAGAAPTTSSYTCRPYLDGNAETCTIDNPAAGSTYYIRVRAYSSFSGVNMKATRTP
jgi:hypothetical protein